MGVSEEIADWERADGFEGRGRARGASLRGMAPDIEKPQVELTVDPQSATAEELNVLAHSNDESVLNAILFNPALNDAHVRAMLERLDLPGTIVEEIAGQGQGMKTAPIRC